MNYCKPELNVLGGAKDVIEIVNQVKQHTQPGDPNGMFNQPAYDLDE